MKTAIDTIREALDELIELRSFLPERYSMIAVHVRMDKAIAALTALKSLEGQGWVSVKDRLPDTEVVSKVCEQSKYVLGYFPAYAGSEEFKIKRVFLIKWTTSEDNGRTEWRGESCEGITHWQELPAPPTTQDPT